MDEQPTLLSFNYRVLDLCEGKAHLCGKILGDLGADVIKVEKPGGDPSRTHSRPAWSRSGWPEAR